MAMLVLPAACKKWGAISLLLAAVLSPLSVCHAQTDEPIDNAAPISSQPESAASSIAETSAQSQVSSQTQTQQENNNAAVTPFYEKSSNTSTAPTRAPGIGSGGHLLNVTLGLMFIVGLIFALSFFVKRFGSGSFVGNGQLKILSSMPLGTRERIVLVDAAGQQLLLGITPTSINTLHVFNEPVVVDNQQSATSDFSQTLMTLLQPKKAARTTSNNNQPTDDKNSSAV